VLHFQKNKGDRVRIAKGFKGKYFSLSAIAVTANTTTLHAQNSIYAHHLPQFASRESESESPPPLDELLLESCTLDLRKNPVAKKACHCSIVFLQRTLQLFHQLRFFIKKLCPCRKTKSGLAPPLFFSF
jgi:hypothetical protein